MKIQTLGSGSIFSTCMSASFLVDNTLLLDVPNGIVKHMKRMNINIGAIDICYISHFHADHFFDLPFLMMEMGLFNVRQRPLTIIGPKGIEEKTTALFNLAYPDVAKVVLDNCRIDFIEVNESTKLNYLNYDFSFKRMQHDATTVYGLTLFDDNKNISFTFDTTYCHAVEQLAQLSDILYIDLSSMETNPYHMGLDSIDKIMAQNKTLTLIATHMSDEVRNHLPKGIIKAKDGWTFDTD